MKFRRKRSNNNNSRITVLLQTTSARDKQTAKPSQTPLFIRRREGKIVDEKEDGDNFGSKTKDAKAMEFSSTFLTSQDLKYNLWPLKLLSVVKILPTEFDIKSGHMGKAEHENVLGRLLYGFWNGFFILRKFLILLTLIHSMVYRERNSGGSGSAGGMHKLLFTNMIDVTGYGLYLGYFTGVVMNMPTITILFNRFIPNLLKNIKSVSSQTGDENKTGRKNFLLSLIRRPFQINLLVYCPFISYSLFPGTLFFALLDPKSSIFLISFVAKSNVESAYLRLAFYVILGIFDCLFFYFVFSLVYIAIFLMLVFVILIPVEIKKSINMLQSSTSTSPGLEKAKESLNLIKLDILLFNLSGSAIVYLIKVISIISAVVGGFGFIKLIHTHPIFAGIYLIFFVVPLVAYYALFDRAFRIQEKVEEFKKNILIEARKSQLKTNQSTQAEYKRVCQSVQRLGIKAGGFCFMERENTLIFVDFVVEKIVELLITSK